MVEGYAVMGSNTSGRGLRCNRGVTQVVEGYTVIGE